MSSKSPENKSNKSRGEKKRKKNKFIEKNCRFNSFYRYDFLDTNNHWILILYLSLIHI